MSARTVWRAFPTLFRIGFASAVAYRGEFLIWVLATNMPLVMLVLFRQVAREAPVGGYGEHDFVVYFLADLVVRLLTGAWVVWEMTMEIRQGDIGPRLLRPVHPFVVWAAEHIASIPLRALLALPVALVSFVLLGGAARVTVLHALLAPVAIAGAWAITFAAMLAVGSLAFRWESAQSVYDVWTALYFVLSGYLMPVDLLPRGLGTVTRWLPFRYCLAFPVEVLTGAKPIGACLVSLAAQWGWAASLFVLARLLFRRGVARYSVFGG